MDPVLDLADSDDGQSALGHRLRQRRHATGLTLQQVADAAGVSVGLISQIERGLTTPSLSTLVKVARVLRQPVSSLLEQPAGAPSTTRSGQRPVYAVGANALTYERISATFPGNVLNSVLIHQPPGYRSEPVTHDGEEIFFVLDGALTVAVENEPHILERGDSIHFASTREHWAWNHTAAPVTFFHICTMDVFGEEARAPAAGRS